MIHTNQTATAQADNSEPFDDRIDILFHELELATKWQCPSLLLAIYSSEYVHGDAEQALEKRLLGLGQKAHHIVVKSQQDADIPLLITELADLNNAVIFVEGLRWGCGEADYAAYQALNKHREFFIENRIRVVFWLTEMEAIHLAHHAPDYWTFRHRVIEFVDSPKPEQVQPQVLESAWQGMSDFGGPAEELDAKITLRAGLLSDLPDGNESTGARANLLLTLGILHWRRGDLDTAGQLLNNALEQAAKLQDPKFEAQCQNAVALVETAAGRLQEAICAYRKAVKLAPEQISPWNNLGNLHYKLEQYEEALEAFEKAVEHAPDDLISWGGLGNTQYKLGRHDDAIYAYQKALELNPNDAACWSSLADVYTQEGQFDEAAAAYQKALGLDCRLTSSWVGMGDIYKLQGNAEKAILSYQTAIEIDPTNARAWDELGNVHYSAAEYTEAIQAYQKAIDLDRCLGQSHSRLASIYFQEGNYAKAVPLLEKALELQQEPEQAADQLNHLGDAYRKLDNYESAMAAYRKADEMTKHSFVPTELPTVPPPADAVEVNPVTVEAGTIDETPSLEATTAESPAEATETPTEVVKLIDDSSTMVNESEIDFAKWLESLSSRPPQAEEPVTLPEEVAPETVIETKEDASPAEEVEALPIEETQPLQAAASELQVEKPAIEAQALEDTQPIRAILRKTQEENPATEPKALEQTAELAAIKEATPDETATSSELSASTPIEMDEAAQPETPAAGASRPDSKSAQIWNELGNIYYNIVAYDEAINALKKALELDHSYGWTYSNLASIYIHKGSYDEAVALLQKGIHFLTEPKDQALLWNRLGDAYRRMGQPDKAGVAYQKALELNPENVSLLTRARFSLLGNCRA